MDNTWRTIAVSRINQGNLMNQHRYIYRIEMRNEKQEGREESIQLQSYDGY